MVNPHAYEKGLVFLQCGGCQVWHQIVDNQNLIEEIDLTTWVPKGASATDSSADTSTGDEFLWCCTPDGTGTSEVFFKIAGYPQIGCMVFPGRICVWAVISSVPFHLIRVLTDHTVTSVNGTLCFEICYRSSSRLRYLRNLQDLLDLFPLWLKCKEPFGFVFCVDSVFRCLLKGATWMCIAIRCGTRGTILERKPGTRRVRAVKQGCKC